jgi:chromosome segregation and condensation protein ScpB
MKDSVTTSAAAQFTATAASLLLLADKPVKCISLTQLTNQNIDSTLLVDHTYTDYASVSDAELLEFDRDWGTALTGDVSPEKRRLVGQLSAMPYKSVWTQPFPIRVRLG